MVIDLVAGQAHIGMRNDVLACQYRGVVTLGLYVESAIRSARIMRARRAHAIWLDLSGAIMAMTPREFDCGSLIPVELYDNLRLPGAMVVPACVLGEARRYAWRQALTRGVERVLFTDVAVAWAWAQRRAQVGRCQAQALSQAPVLPRLAA